MASVLKSHLACNAGGKWICRKSAATLASLKNFLKKESWGVGNVFIGAL
jgi:hypothetical protein